MPWDHPSAWWGNPFSSDTYYVDENGVRWVVKRELGGAGGRTTWRARPETEAARYGIVVDRWPVVASTTYDDDIVDGYAKSFKFFGMAVDDWVAARAGKPAGTLLLVLLALWLLGSDKGRYSPDWR